MPRGSSASAIIRPIAALFSPSSPPAVYRAAMPTSAAPMATCNAAAAPPPGAGTPGEPIQEITNRLVADGHISSRSDKVTARAEILPRTGAAPDPSPSHHRRTGACGRWRPGRPSWQVTLATTSDTGPSPGARATLNCHPTGVAPEHLTTPGTPARWPQQLNTHADRLHITALQDPLHRRVPRASRQLPHLHRRPDRRRALAGMLNEPLTNSRRVAGRSRFRRLRR